MGPLFNKTKVKSWIKKAHKNQSLVYGHGYITDNYVMLIDEPHMHPTILEVFGTLTPECRYSAEQFQKMATLPNKPVAVVDSELEYAPDAKRRLRIFYDPTTGKKLAIKGMYFDLLDDPRLLRFFTNDSMSVLWIICDNDDVVGAVAPVRLQDQLTHMSFKAENEVS
jgi:hypothetical protein